MAKAYRASVTVIKEKNLTKNYPLFMLSAELLPGPLLNRLTMGKRSSPKITLVGKGVCFDSGGLDIKPASGMLNMKKDMGGAAQVLGPLIMDGFPRLRVLILPLKMQSQAMHSTSRRSPNEKGDNRRGGNTDAEGRLILSDALTEASKDKPEMIIDFATLTGAARVAVGQIYLLCFVIMIN